jgi:hypothetical protein
VSDEPDRGGGQCYEFRHANDALAGRLEHVLLGAWLPPSFAWRRRILSVGCCSFAVCTGRAPLARSDGNLAYAPRPIRVAKGLW